MQMNKLIALTGATGFIGRSIVQKLLEAGYSVRVLIRSESGASWLRELDVTLVWGDLENRSSLEQLVTGVGAVVHCAGAVRGATAEQFDRVNVRGTHNLVEAVIKCGVTPRLLVLSSLAAREPTLSYYCASKKKMEEMLKQKASNLDWIALRPPAVYGPGDKELLPLFRIMAKGFAPVPGVMHSRFSLVFVDDLVNVVVTWLRAEHSANGIYALDDGHADGYSWHDVADAVARLCRRSVHLQPIPFALMNVVARLNSSASRLFGYAPMLTPEKLRELRHPDWVCDSQQLTAAIGWRPQIQLTEGLRRTPGWCSDLKSNGRAG